MKKGCYFRLLAVLLLFIVAGCAAPPAPLPTRVPPPPSVPQSYPPKPQPLAGPAAQLFHDAERYLASGNYSQAEMSLERALRIEPKNGYYWHAMAQTKYRQGQYQQAINLCLKSTSLAGQDRGLVARNNALIDQARQHQ